MPLYSYRAIGRDGKIQNGSLEARGLDVAARELRTRGLTLLNIDTGAGAANLVAADSAVGAGSLRRQDLLSFTNELSVLLRAGLPLDRALRVLIDMSSRPEIEQLLQALLAGVKSGKSLSEALQPYASDFGAFYLNMLRSGEAGGHLSQVLDDLVRYLQTSKQNRDTVISALIYPAILAVVSLLSIVLMLGFVVPQFETLFADMGDAVPTLTRIIIAAANFISAYGWLLLLGVTGLVFFVRQRISSEAGRRRLHQRLLRFPVAGEIVFEFEVARFARTAGTLLGNGVSLLKAISIAIDTVGNEVVRNALEVLPPAVKAGRRMSQALQETEQFSPLVVQMVRVGEESGNLDAMLLELANVFDDHVQSGIKRGLALLEPILILGMGFFIALIIIAILMGIMSVNDLAL
ncbi:MAG: type II secretion system inner membrane protein GspF [Halioglobus sp.]